MFDLESVLALPMDYDGLRVDEASLRTNNVNDYKVTCIDFIKDIANDYFAWVDYYKLPEEEDKRRRAGINSTVERTNEWIAKVPQTIKAIDVVMNDRPDAGAVVAAVTDIGRQSKPPVRVCATRGGHVHRMHETESERRPTVMARRRPSATPSLLLQRAYRSTIDTCSAQVAFADGDVARRTGRCGCE